MATGELIGTDLLIVMIAVTLVGTYLRGRQVGFDRAMALMREMEEKRNESD